MFLNIRRAGLLLLMLLLAACNPASSTPVTGSGSIRQEDRAVQGYERVEIKNFAQATIYVDGTESLSIEADDNLYPYLVAEVSGGTLRVGVQDNLSLSGVTLHFTIHTKALNGLVVNGAGSIDAHDIQTDSLNISINGTGSLNLSGTAERQAITFDGGGSFNGSTLAGSEASVIINGAASVELNVSDNLNVTINGTGSVAYTGSPTLTQNINGTGRVQQVEP